MLQIFLFLLLSSCSNKVVKINNQPRKESIFVSKVQFFNEKQLKAKLSLITGINATKTSLKEDLLLLKDPNLEEFSLAAVSSAQKFSIEKSDQDYFLVVKSKKYMERQPYGLYERDKEHQVWHLIYTFYMENGPKLIEPNMLKEEKPRVSDKKLIFSLEFDQPMRALHEQVISITSDGQPLTLNYVNVSQDKKNIRVKLEDFLWPNKNYRLALSSDLTNIYGSSVTPLAVEFITVIDSNRLLVLQTLETTCTDTVLIFTWALSQRHDAELYLFSDNNNTLGKIYLARSSSKKGKPLIKHIGHLVVTDLQPLTKYSFVLRIADDFGHIMIARGQI
jgi:hypothetical protein